jgi:DNA-binding XRE family transcriptional regulator
MTQTQLARAAGVSRVSIQRAEHGLPMSRIVQVAIARALGKTRKDLFTEGAA